MVEKYTSRLCERNVQREKYLCYVFSVVSLAGVLSWVLVNKLDVGYYSYGFDVLLEWGGYLWGRFQDTSWSDGEGGGCKINLVTKLCGKVYQIFNAENGFLADFTSSSLTSQAFVSFCYVL